MIHYKTIIKKFEQKGEKTGWTYIEIPHEIAQQLQPNCKKSFRVKGKFDDVVLDPISILPMGEGHFILPLNLSIRKQIKKQRGAEVSIELAFEPNEYKLNEDFIDCLNDEPKAFKHFNTLTKSHQNYFSKWIESTKTIETKTNLLQKL
jgi:hypothetical protein